MSEKSKAEWCIESWDFNVKVATSFLVTSLEDVERARDSLAEMVNDFILTTPVFKKSIRNITLDEVLQVIKKEYQSRASYKIRLRSKGHLSFAGKMEWNKTLVEERLLVSIMDAIREMKDEV